MRIAFTEDTELTIGDSIVVKGRDQEGRRVTIELHCRDIKIDGLPCDGHIKIPAEELNA